VGRGLLLDVESMRMEFKEPFPTLHKALATRLFGLHVLGFASASWQKNVSGETRSFGTRRSWGVFLSITRQRAFCRRIWNNGYLGFAVFLGF
jgi:hypothetical protein